MLKKKKNFKEMTFVLVAIIFFKALCEEEKRVRNSSVISNVTFNFRKLNRQGDSR